MALPKLTIKQRLFCKAYVSNGWNATQAAKTAGYSEKTAGKIGFENLSKPEIIKGIDHYKGNLEETIGVSKGLVLQKWLSIALANITDIFDIDNEGKIRVKDGKRLSDLPKEATDIISSVKEAKEGLEIKLLSQEIALKEIARLMGYNEPDKQELSGGIAINTFDVGFAADDQNQD